MSTSRNRIPILYILLFGVIIVMFVLQFQNTPETEELTLNQLAADIQAQIVKRVEIEEEVNLIVKYNNGDERETRKESLTGLVEQLLMLGVSPENLSPSKIEIKVNSPSAWANIINILAILVREVDVIRTIKSQQIILESL